MSSPVDRRRISHHQALERRRAARRELEAFTRRLMILLVALLVIVVLGTIAFCVTEGVSVGYGLLWTLDTVTTLGALRDPPDTAGRTVIVLLELFGIGTLFYGLVTMAEFFVSGQLSGLRDERRNQRMIDSYSDHFIICGFGRVGRQVARDLGLAGVKHVAIDSDPSHREQAESLGVRYIESYAADDDALMGAGIMRARAVIACVDSDADNIFVALSARGMRPDILIIARASAEDAEKKLLRAGADRVISPYKTSGSEMARLALHPQVGGAVQVADYRMEEIEVLAPCEGVGKTIEQVRGDAVVVAVRHTDGRLEPQPAPASVVEAGQLLVAIGTPAALDRLETMFQPVTVAARAG
ncbi:MAG: potassium channel family protein [Solirubrobacteraceae bacterium]